MKFSATLEHATTKRRGTTTMLAITTATIATTAAINTTARLLAPLINDLYSGAKKVGVHGFLKWNATTFARKLARRIRVIEEVKTLWIPDKRVSLTTFYYPSKIMVDGKSKPLMRLFELGDGNTVVEGIVGQGKSILLRYLALQEVLSNDVRRLPVFVELRTLSEKLSLQQAIIKQLSSYDIDLDDASLNYLLKSGRVSYLLDGFDELDESLTKETLHELEFLSQKYPQLQIVITSRPANEIQKSVYFNIVKIAQLAPPDYTAFLTKLGLPAIKVALIKEAIRSSPSNVSHLITTPLMLTLVVIVYESEKEIPETLPEFFERLFQVVFTRHDRLKAAFDRKHHSGLSERQLQNLFEAFCFMAMQNGYTRSLSTKQFEDSFDEALQYSDNCTCDLELFKLDITKVACLMLEEGLDTTTFLHKSIMEYYAASFVKNSTDEVAALFYGRVLSDSRPWWEVLSFLKSIDPYRYSRDFAIPEIISIRSNVITPLINRDDESLINAVETTFPDLTIGLSRRPNAKHNNELSIVSFGPFFTNRQMALTGLDDLLIHAMQRTMPDGLSEAQTFEIFGDLRNSNQDATGELKIPVQMQIRKFGAKYFWEAFDIFSTTLDKRQSEATAVMEKQERRKRIFERPIKIA